MVKFKRTFSLLIITFSLFGCVRVHHVQVTSLDTTVQGRPVEVLIDKIGVDAAKVVKNIEGIHQIMSGSKKPNNEISNTIAMFQSGPKTGAPVFEASWGEQLLSQLIGKCPSKRLENIYTQRLTTDYGGSGVTREVVLVKATCLE